MLAIDISYSTVDPNNPQSCGSRIWSKIYENRISCLFFSILFFSADFIGAFIIEDPAWVTPVMLATGMAGGVCSIAMFAREVDLARGLR